MGGQQMVNKFWGSDGLRNNSTGLTGMEVLARAAIVENKGADGLGGIEDHAIYNQYESSLDKAVAELHKKIANDADAANNNNASVVSGGGGGGAAGSNIKNTEKETSSVAAAAQVVAQELADAQAAVAAKVKRSREEQQNPSVVPSYHVISSAQRAHQDRLQRNKKLKLMSTSASSKSPTPTTSSSADQYASAVTAATAAVQQGAMDRKDVWEKLQAVAERQEFLRLRQEVKNLNHAILQLQQQSIESDNRVMEAIADRRVALNECKNLQEINAQLKTELRRMVLLFEQTNNNQTSATANTNNANNGDTGAGGPNNASSTANGTSNNESAQATAQGSDANAAELFQAKLTESELRYHAVTESLSRQTGVLTDQHRAIVELNTQLEQERAKRQSVEYELNQLKTALQQHQQQQQQQALNL